MKQSAQQQSSGISRMIIKAMGIFGGVQMVGILCSIVRVKLVSLWIGPAGMGLFALFNNALEMLNNATNLGLRNSTVPEIAQAHNTGHRGTVATIVTVVRRWSMWLGLLGALLTIALAPLLSNYTFGSPDYLWHFVALSVAVLLMALTNGEQAILQGSQQLRRLAHVGLWGTLLGLAVSIPMFYWLRERSIVPSILAYAAANALMAFVLRDRTYPPAQVEARDTFRMGSGFVRLGIYMTIGTFVAYLTNYIFSAWLNRYASTAEVGYYQAGFNLINKYTGIVFTALGMEYFPRLASVANHPRRLHVFVSQEVNVLMLMLVPVIAGIIVLRSVIVWLLYTPDFYVIEGFITWGMVGMVARGLSWCVAFVILARGDGRTYVVTESLSAVLGLVFNIVGFRLWGITGLGIAFALWYVAYVVIVAVVYFWRYRLTLSRGCLASVAWALAVSVAMMALMEVSLTAAALLAVVSTAVSAKLLLSSWRR